MPTSRTQQQLHSILSLEMSHGKQFTLYSSVGAPNGWKVAFILEELDLTYETVFYDLRGGEHLKPEHVALNPNGRIPTLVDHHNGDFTIWESDAIMYYLVDKYDKEQKLAPTTENDKYTYLQWLFFQSSGQGPYFGQATWFMNFHKEQLPSAIERYQDETIRIFGVLESVLSKQEWLAGNKCTAADLSFVPWTNIGVDIVLPKREDFNFERDYPAVFAWHNKVKGRKSVSKLLALRAELLKK